MVFDFEYCNIMKWRKCCPFLVLKAALQPLKPGCNALAFTKWVNANNSVLLFAFTHLVIISALNYYLPEIYAVFILYMYTMYVCIQYTIIQTKQVVIIPCKYS